MSKRANEMKKAPCMGRSHGMNAEPMSFGQKLLNFYAELYRNYQDIVNFTNTELTIQVSGAVGNYTIVDTALEQEVATQLGLATTLDILSLKSVILIPGFFSNI